MADIYNINISAEDFSNIDISKGESSSGIPVDKHSIEDIFGNRIPINFAINSGLLQMKCFINRHCPFCKSGKVEDVVVFNASTIPNIAKFAPASFAENIAVTDYLEGMHLVPKYVYRHNYLFELTQKKTEDGKYYWAYIENGGENSSVFGVNETRYKKEQSFFLVESVFKQLVIDTQSSGAGAVTEGSLLVKCKNRSSYGGVWRYRKINTDSQANSNDLKLDYKKDFYKTYLSGLSSDESGVTPDLTSFSIKDTQMMAQIATVDDTQQGIHWRLKKQTPLYRGEDFFIEFHKLTKDTSPTQYKENSNLYINQDKYKCLDVRLDPSQNMKPYKGSSEKFPINNAVRYKIDENSEDVKTYDFSDQAYYVIEMGDMGINDQHYFIIITERGNPVLVTIVDGISFVCSIYKKIVGKYLLRVPSFRMTVRNHLGKIIIAFEGEGIDLPVWICTRDDLEISGSEKNGDLNVKTIPRMIFVDRGDLYIWGGNMACGIVFGPLQYGVPFLELNYPPQPILNEGERATTGKEGGNRVYTVSPEDPLPVPPYISLPYGVDHEIKFTVSDIEAEEIVKSLSIQTSNGNRLFTQDACMFWEHIEKNKVLTDNYYQFGYFFYGQPLKELSEANTKSGFSIKHSAIWVYKNKQDSKSDSNRKMENFSVNIGLMAGDHLFLDAETENIHIKASNPNINFANIDSLDDSEWILLDCKTPIISSIRFTAAQNPLSRWDDGTNGNYSPIPDQNYNSFPMEVSELILSYNDNWSSSGFNLIDHSASISFLLNGYGSGSNPKADYLYSLLNKTFYVEIWAGYKSTDNSQNSYKKLTGSNSLIGVNDSQDNYSKLKGFYRMFTGLIFGGTIEHKAESKIMNCKIYDYTKILQDQFFFNSPWFDGMRDGSAINEILNLAGFKSLSPYDPGFIIDTLANGIQDVTVGEYGDGRKFIYKPYALPSGYQRFEQPAFKFKDGEPFFSAIQKIAERSGKLFYFDQFGIAHYENYMDLVREESNGAISNIFSPLFKFTTTPTNLSLIDSNSASLYPGQLIFNTLNWGFNVETVYNHIKTLSNTPDMTPIFADDLEWGSIEDPTKEGFIGYLKTFYQEEGSFGSQENAAAIMNFYRIMFRPPITFNFESYGLPLRALDIISVNEIKARVVKVDHKLDPKTNSWWMTLECEMFQQIQPTRT